MSVQSLMILIAGPYRSVTGDHPERMASNLRVFESIALPLFRAGHLRCSANGLRCLCYAKRLRSTLATLSTTKSSTLWVIDCSGVATRY